MHYQRDRNHGDVGVAGTARRGPKPVDLEERFWPKVDKDGPLSEARPDLGPCWIWLGNRTNLGYALFHVNVAGKWVKRKAHTVAYEIEVGPAPPGLEPDHLCRVPRCVNPSHLEWVTHRENVLRGRSPAADQARQTHCLREHPLSGDNLYVKPNGKRECRACRRILAARAAKPTARF